MSRGHTPIEFTIEFKAEAMEANGPLAALSSLMVDAQNVFVCRPRRIRGGACLTAGDSLYGSYSVELPNSHE